MSPLTLVGMLLIATSTLADVKHVLEGSAHPPEPNSISPEDVNHLASNPPNGQYWWMGPNSPFKAAYDYYKKCNLKGNCPTPITPNAPPPQPFKPQDTVNIDVKKNPFLSGGFTKGNANYNDNSKIDISKNPFLSGSVVTAGNGSPVTKDQDGFLGVQPSQPFGKKPGFATTHPLDSKKKPGFATKHPLDQGKQSFGLLNITVECKGDGFMCVEKSLCLNGVVNNNGEGLLHVRSDVHYCEENKEVCCKVNNLNEITAGKSSVPGSTIKFAGGAGFSPGLIHVQPLNVQPEIVFGGENGHHSSSTAKSIRDTSLGGNSGFSSTVDYSDTKFDSDVRFASTFQGPAYLPPVAPTSPAPRPFETRQPSINQQYVPSRPSTPQYIPPSPSPSPSPSPTFPSVSTTFRPAPSPTYQPSPFVTSRPAPSTSREYLPPRQPTPGPSTTVTQYQPPYQPSVTPPRPYQPSVTPSRPYQPSVTPQQPSVTPPRPYQPSVTPQRPYQPSVTPQQPYQPSVTPQQPYQPSIKPYQPSPTTPRPYQPQPTTPKPYQPSYQPSTPRPTTSREYLPPVVPQSTPRPPSFPTQPPRPSYQPPPVTQPRPAPSPQYPTPTPNRPSYPSPSQPTPGYQYPTPPQTRPTSPPFRPTPSVPRFPSSPSTNGYQYPTPSSPRPTPFQPQQPPQRPVPSYTSPQYVPPSTPSRPIPTQPTYQPSTQRPYVPQQTTPHPNPAGGYEYPKPTPTFGYPSPRPDFGNSNVNNQYVPPPRKPEITDENPDAANIDGAFLRPSTPRPQYQGELNTAPPPGCAAALKCVQEIYCTAEGVISPVPVVLTKEQELSRVPTTECQDTESGIIGKCCRDPNYKDPWPSANLVNGFDDGQYKEDDSIGQYGSNFKRNVRSQKGGPRQDFNNGGNANVPPQPTCGERHQNTNPKGQGPLDVNFAEIPWQAMILRDSNRSLLCGGAIIRNNAVLTTARCVEGIETSDLLIKGGEWKLGIDEEPLPFQIVKVSVVVRHPQYVSGSYINDLAVLILEEKLRPSKNIGTICLPAPNQIPAQNCIATGWGKRILQLHARGAIMHAIDVKIMDNRQCQQTLADAFQHASSNYSPNTLCGYSDRDQCRVDYGSALACTDGNQYTLSGIFSWDTGCKQKGQIGGYVAPDVEWIESTLAKPIRELKNLQS